MRTSRYHNPYLATLSRPVKQRACDCPGCSQTGSFKAPRSRARLKEYYWFCLDHVREYNARWDYLKGLSPEEIEGQIRDASVWDRPTWPFTEAQRRERAMRDGLHRDFFSKNADQDDPVANGSPSFFVGEREALAVLDLEPPVDLAAIKARYRLLVKRHHPDANGGSREAEEKFKIINQAFTTLRALYGSEEDA